MPNWFNIHTHGEDAYLFIGNDIGSDQAVEELLKEIEPARKVHCTIDSGGGFSDTALLVYEALIARETHVTIRGRAASAAALIAMSGSRISMEQGARMMVHAASLAVYGNVRDLTAVTARLRDSDVMAAAIFERRTKLPPATIARWHGGDDCWFDAETCVALGLADEILTASSNAGALDVQDRLPVSKAPASSQTEAEKFFFEVLRAFGSFTVSDRTRFCRELNTWLSANLRQENPK